MRLLAHILIINRATTNVLDLDIYRDKLEEEFNYEDFQKFKSFVKNDLKELKYYSDYLVGVSVIDELIKNEDAILKHKGFWCSPPYTNEDNTSSCSKLVNLADKLHNEKIVFPKPLTVHGGRIYLSIVDTERFYKFVCNEIRQLSANVLDYYKPKINASQNIIKILFNRNGFY